MFLCIWQKKKQKRLIYYHHAVLYWFACVKKIDVFVIILWICKIKPQHQVLVHAGKMNGNVITVYALMPSSNAMVKLIVPMVRMKMEAPVNKVILFCLHSYKKNQQLFKIEVNQKNKSDGKAKFICDICVYFFFHLMYKKMSVYVALNLLYIHICNEQTHNFHHFKLKQKPNSFFKKKHSRKSNNPFWMIFLISIAEECDGILCDNQCHPLSIRCNGYQECSDGYDEENCPEPEDPYTTTTTQAPPKVFFFCPSI